MPNGLYKTSGISLLLSSSLRSIFPRFSSPFLIPLLMLYFWFLFIFFWYFYSALLSLLQRSHLLIEMSIRRLFFPLYKTFYSFFFYFCHPFKKLTSSSPLPFPFLPFAFPFCNSSLLTYFLAASSAILRFSTLPFLWYIFECLFLH